MHADVIKLIPYGKENAVSRDVLSAKVGCSDRTMRNLINKARRRVVIINLQNGKGYYRPTDEDVDDVLKYKLQEENRAKDIFNNLQPVREFLRGKR